MLSSPLAPEDLLPAQGQATPAAAAPAPVPSGGQAQGVESFVQTYLPLARNVSAQTGVTPEALLGQWGLETGWGKSVIPGTNNLGNIKDVSRKGPVAVDNATKSSDSYMQFDSPESFGDHYAGLLSRRYASALNAQDPQKFFTELKRGGYAEDPNYITKGVAAANMVNRVLGKDSSPVVSIHGQPAPATGDYYTPKQSDLIGYEPDNRTFFDKVIGGAQKGLEQSISLTGKTAALINRTMTGEVDNDFQKSAMEFAKRHDEAASKASRNAPEFTDVWNGDGNFSDWLADSIGYLGYQVGESVLTGGVGALAARTLGKEFVIDAAKNMVAKRATELAATEAGKKMTKEQIASAAAKAAATDLGAVSTVFANNLRQEAGSIYGDAKEGEDKGQDPANLFKIWTSALAATGLDTAGEVAAARGLLGREGSSAKSYLGRAATQVPRQVGIQSGTEFGQTLIENYGANKDPFSAESLKDAVNAAAVGALGGLPAGAGAAIHRRPAGPLSRAADAAGASTPEAANAGSAATPQIATDPTARLAELEAIGKGTPDSTVPGPFGQPVVVPGTPGRLFTPEEKAEYDQLVALRDATPGQAPKSPEDRLAELEAIQRGSSEVRDGNNQVSQRAQVGRTLTPEERAEYESLKAAKKDEISDRVAEIEGALRNNNALQTLRNPDSPISVKDLLRDLAQAKSKSTNKALREQALARIEFAAEWAGIDLTPVTKPDQNPAESPASPASPQVAPARTPQDAVSQMAGQLSADDRSQVIAAMAVHRNPNAPQSVRNAALAEALQIVGRYQAAAMPTAGSTQAPALFAPRQDTPEYFLAEAERRENGAYQFRELGFDEEANALRAEADSLREKAASAQAGELGQEFKEDDSSAASQGQQTVEQATSGLPRPVIEPATGPATADNTALRRKRKAQLRQLADAGGFRTIVKEGDRHFMVNVKTGARVNLETPADVVMARAAISESIRADSAKSPNSPANDRAESSAAQNEAGNYYKPVTEQNGIKIRVENDKGSMRRGIDPDGNPWESEMKAVYGHAELYGPDGKRIKAADGDDPDVFIGDRPDSHRIFVIDQINPDGTFDEPKTVMGVTDEAHARRTYLANYEPGWTGLGAITEMTRDGWLAWAKNGGSKQPLAYGKNLFTVNDGGVNVPLQAIDTDEVGDKSAVRLSRGKPVSKKDAELIKMIGAVFGIKVQFYRALDPNWSGDGFVSGSGSTIYMRETTTRSPLAIFGHEFMHLLRRAAPEAYESMAKVVAANIKSPKAYREEYFGKYVAKDVNGNKVGAFHSEEQATAAANGGTVTEQSNEPLENKELEELVSDLNGDLMMDSKFWADVFRQVQRDYGDSAKGIIARMSALLTRAIDAIVGSLRGGEFNAGQFVNNLKDVRQAYKDGLSKFLGEAMISKRSMQAETLRAEQKSKGEDIKFSPERPDSPVIKSSSRQTDTPEFKAWFGKSEIVDEQGDPLVVYTGTSKDVDFKSFKVPKNGVWFTTDPYTASAYAQENDSKGLKYDPDARKYNEVNTASRVIPAYLKIEKLYKPTYEEMTKMIRAENYKREQGTLFDQARAKGYDGIDMGNGTYVVIGKPEQIKSAIGNSGAFSLSKGDITKSADRADALTLDGYHFSQQPRELLSSGLHGQGLQDANREQFKTADDPRLRQRIYFYVDKGSGITPLAGLGAHAHRAKLSGVYDMNRDALDLRRGKSLEDFESAVLDAGYEGYLDRREGTQPGVVVMLGQRTIKPEYLGVKPSITGAAVAPAPLGRVADLADRINNNRNLPAGALTPQRWAEVLMMQMPEEAAELLNLGAIAGNDPMYRNEFASAVRRQATPMQKSAERAEYHAVKQKYKGTDGWLKAPNGSPTNLTERQWIHVRTPSFLKWFGPWLSYAESGKSVWAGYDVSKVVDANGEPMVVYHGTDEGGFVSFKSTGGKSRGDLGIWTTDDIGMAMSYVHRNRPSDVELPSDPENQADLENLGYSFDENDGLIEVTDPDGYLYDRYDSIEEAVKETLDRFEMPDMAGESPGVYALFLNIRNPHESDFEGANWEGSRSDQYEVRDEDGNVIDDDDGRMYLDKEAAEDLASRNPGSVVESASNHWETTDDVAKEARRSKSDGAIIRNVTDNGGGYDARYDGEPKNIFVAFDPNQAKSADYNNGEYSASSDIRKSAERVGDVARHNLVADRSERTTASRVVLSDKERVAIAAGARLGLMTAAEIEDSVRTTKAAHPMADGWAPLVFDRVKVEKDDDGKTEPTLIYKAVPYSFNTDSNGRALKPDTPDYLRAIGRIARNMASDVRSVYRRAAAGDKVAGNIIEQAAWYKAMRTRLRQEFGGLGDLFADLLGATSPNTPVRGNWDNAVDSLRRAMRGDFDELMPRWLAWAKHLDYAESRFKDFFNAMLERGLSKKQIKELGEYKWLAARAAEAREIPDDLLPSKESGKKYGFNGKNVVRAMVDLWRVVKDADPDINRGGTAPKALNFSGNLIGFRDRSTIDVWAARNLQRNSGGLRIPSAAETGVSGDMLRSGATTLQFGFGQDVFTKAVSLIRNDPEMAQSDVLRKINDDDLQALIWFVEKEIWTKNNWTSAAGEGGSFEFESDLAGVRDQDRVRKLRRIADSSVAASREQKAAAQARLYELADELEPYQNASEAMVRVKQAKQAVDAARKGDSSAQALRKLASKQSDLADAVQAMNDVLDVLPKSLRSTGKVAAKIKALRAEGTRLANTFKKPLPEQLRANREAALRDLTDMARTVDRFIIGLSLEKSSELQGGRRVPTDDEQAAAANELRDATYQADDGRTVLASKFYSTEGRYGRPERAIDGEVVARDGYDLRPLAAKVFGVAQREQQDSAFVARILRADEEVDLLRHRPGVEIYFRNAATAAQAEALMRRVNRTAVPRADVDGDRRARFFRVGGYTVIVDGRRTPESLSGAMPKAVGMRIMYLPEFNARYGDTEMLGLDDSQIRDKMTSAADDLVNFVDRVIQKVPEVSFGGRFNYEVDARFADEYQGAIDDYTDRDAAAGNRAGKTKAWSGRSVREAVAAAIGRDGAESAQSESAVPGGDGQSGGIRKSAERGDDRRGDPRGGRAPLPGAPSNEGTQGPDAALVSVAERYARDNGIELRRQAEYVTVNPELAKRIADAYVAMPHTPDDPRVRASYDALIRETRAQYDALVEDGYRFTFFDEKSDPYQGNPWNAMRDLRENKSMAVYGTYDGYGNDVTGFKANQNLLVVPTGLQWTDQSGVMREVTANDLFRAVHDAFGHGLEGAGFRGRGEANAFEAHARLFSPAAMMALTNETRAQNSWLNYGPYGEHNRTAKVKDTIFADQKNGVLPEWTWTEGRAGDMPTYNDRVQALKDLISCLKK